MILISWPAGRARKFSNFVLLLCTFLLGACATPPDLAENIERQPQVHEIEIKKFRFNPATLYIQRGDVVRWVNKDIVPHRLADSVQSKWQSQDMVPQDSFSQPIMMSTLYVCVLHPGMQANIVVREN